METVVEVVKEGVTAPDFTLESGKGPVKLAQYLGRQNVVLYFMREFSCPACRQHVRELSQLYPQLQASGTDVLVIGGGTQEEANRLSETYKLPFTVAADPDRETYHNYGLHRAMGMIQRSGSIVVDKQGIVRYVQRVTLPTGALDKKELLAALAQL